MGQNDAYTDRESYRLSNMMYDNPHDAADELRNQLQQLDPQTATELIAKTKNSEYAGGLGDLQIQVQFDQYGHDSGFRNVTMATPEGIEQIAELQSQPPAYYQMYGDSGNYNYDPMAYVAGVIVGDLLWQRSRGIDFDDNRYRGWCNRQLGRESDWNEHHDEFVRNWGNSDYRNRWQNQHNWQQNAFQNNTYINNTRINTTIINNHIDNTIINNTINNSHRTINNTINNNTFNNIHRGDNNNNGHNSPWNQRERPQIPPIPALNINEIRANQQRHQLDEQSARQQGMRHDQQGQQQFNYQDAQRRQQEMRQQGGNDQMQWQQRQREMEMDQQQANRDQAGRIQQQQQQQHERDLAQRQQDQQRRQVEEQQERQRLQEQQRQNQEQANRQMQELQQRLQQQHQQHPQQQQPHPPAKH